MKKEEVRKEVQRISSKPHIKLRLRAYDLETLHKQEMTKCDICAKTVRVANALESWKGNVCVYVACFSCLSKSPLQFVNYPDGLHVDYQDGVSTGIVRGSDSLLPNTRR